MDDIWSYFLSIFNRQYFTLFVYVASLCVVMTENVCALSLQAHSNETVGSLRNKIAKVLKVPADQIQFLSNEKMVCIKIILWFC